MARTPGVRRRGDRWQVRVQVNGRALSKSFPTYTAAAKWRSAQVAESSRAAADAVMPLDEWWERHRSESHLRPSTVARNLSAYQTYIGPAFGKVPIDQLARSDATAWVQELVDLGLAPSTIARVVEVASGCLQRAVDHELIARNPFHRLGLPKVENHERRFLTAAEVRRIEAEMDPWWSIVVPFAFDTGLRISELAGLYGRDIEFSNPAWVVHVRRIVTDTDGKVRTGPPKTRAGVRSVPTLTRPVAERLAAHIAEREIRPTEPLFASRRGGVMRPTNWRARVFTPAVRSAGLGADVTPHSIRHGAVARWIAAGQSDPYVLSRWLGHSTPMLVYRTYAHLLPQDVTAITDRMTADASVASGESATATVTAMRPSGGSI